MTCYRMTMDFFGQLGELTSVTVTSPNDCKLRSVRGKTTGAIVEALGTFQWTSAVRALCAVLVRAKIASVEGSTPTPLWGEAGSLASSLDYAICKQPLWLVEMFGTLPTGDCVAKRLFRVTNSSRKRPGPVVVGLNSNLLSAENIEFYWEGVSCSDAALLRCLLKNIEGSSLQVSQAYAAAA
jgi:hypothetical protein